MQKKSVTNNFSNNVSISRAALQSHIYKKTLAVALGRWRKKQKHNRLIDAQITNRRGLCRDWKLRYERDVRVFLLGFYLEGIFWHRGSDLRETSRKVTGTWGIAIDLVVWCLIFHSSNNHYFCGVVKTSWRRGFYVCWYKIWCIKIEAKM
jgi:hypothetical protein